MSKKKLAYIFTACAIAIGGLFGASQLGYVHPVTQRGLNNALTLAAKDGDLNAVKSLVGKGADIYVGHAKSNIEYLLVSPFFENAPLQYAAAKGHADVLKFLLEYEWAHRNDEGHNPMSSYTGSMEGYGAIISYAAKSGDDGILKTQLDFLKSISNGKSILPFDAYDTYSAAYNGHKNIVELSVQYGINLDDAISIAKNNKRNAEQDDFHFGVKQNDIAIQILQQVQSEHSPLKKTIPAHPLPHPA